MKASSTQINEPASGAKHAFSRLLQTRKRYLAVTFGGLLLYGFLWRWSGEGLTQEQLVVSHQSYAPHGLVGLKGRDIGGFFKLRSSLARKPELMIIGSSRALTLRGSLFKQGTSFYNAGYSVRNPDDALSFVKHLAAVHKPKLLLFSMDQWCFNARSMYAHMDGWQREYDGEFAQPTPLLPTGTHMWDLVAALPQCLPSQWQRRDSVGIRALAEQSGFRNLDGSRRGTPSIYWKNPSLADYQFHDGLSQIEHGTGRFVTGSTVDPAVLERLKALAQHCQQNQVQLIAFFPPFASSIHQGLLESTGHGYYSQVGAKAKDTLSTSNALFLDFSDVKSLGATDEEMIDSIHPGEKLYARMLQQMAAQSSALNPFVDSTAIAAAIAEPHSAILLPDD